MTGKTQISRKDKIMIRINQVKLSIFDCGEEKLKKKCAQILKTEPHSIRKLRVVRRSADARKKDDILFSYIVDVKLSDSVTGPNAETEKAYIKKLKNRDVCYEETIPLRISYPEEPPFTDRPVVVGAGPCGLFCALILAEAGLHPIVIERGSKIEDRAAAVEEFFMTGAMDPETNVQFGEGGAGAFSDGKLNTSVKGQGSYIRYVLETFRRFGAEEDILYDAKPHIGTDMLLEIVKNMREEIKRLGGEFLFDTKVTGFRLSEDKKSIKGVIARGKQGDVVTGTAHCVLAIGHSARDTFELLHNEYNIPMEKKPFAMGIRIQHPQDMIDRALYGDTRLDEKKRILGPSPYKLTHKASGGRGVYSFCMCPGGYVVNSSSEEGMLCVNGMSYSDRGGENANSAIVVNVTAEDMKGDDPLAGMKLQREIESAAYRAGNGNIPMETYGDFKAGNTEPRDIGEVLPAVKGYTNMADVRALFPEFIGDAIVEGIEAFSRMIPGFNRADALICGPETRTSSPVRILRDEGFESSIKGLYPAGEGAGYAGGITSAAIDGIKTAEKLLNR